MIMDMNMDKDKDMNMDMDIDTDINVDMYMSEKYCFSSWRFHCRVCGHFKDRQKH